MNAAGAVAPAGTPTSTPGGSGMAVSPDGRFAYLSSGGEGIRRFEVAANGSLTSVGLGVGSGEYGDIAISPDGRRIYFQYLDPTLSEEGIGVAALGVDGIPTPLPSFAAWETSEDERIVFAPGPTPVAAFSAAPATAGQTTRFDASGSTGAARYDWSFGDGTVATDAGPGTGHVYASPGTYTVKLKVTDANGCSSEQIYTGQSTTCPGGAAAEKSVAVVVPAVDAPIVTVTPPKSQPRILSLRVTPKRFAPGRAARASKGSVGTTFHYSLSEKATVRFQIERKSAGRLVGGKCARVSRGNEARKHCPLFRSLGAPPTANAKAGANSTPFSGNLAGKPLAAGPYRVTAVASADGVKSAPRSAAFQITAP